VVHLQEPPKIWFIYTSWIHTTRSPRVSKEVAIFSLFTWTHNLQNSTQPELDRYIRVEREENLTSTRTDRVSSVAKTGTKWPYSVLSMSSVKDDLHNNRDAEKLAFSFSEHNSYVI
jgi:hypothetical protein